MREKFIRTTAINKILSMKGRINGVRGGTSAGKTYGVLPVLIDMMAKIEGLEVSVVAETIPHIKRGAMKDFKKILASTNRWNRKFWNASERIYTFPNGSTIEFFSADDDSKLRGARRDVLYVNEANNITFEAFTELFSRTKMLTFLDWNPVGRFWFDDHLLGDDDVDFLVLTYQDNEACPPSARDFILKAKEKAKTSEYWANWYKVYGLGEIGGLEGLIFTNWKQIDGIPPDAKLLGYGIDFGHSNPTAVVAVYSWNGKRILDEVLYRPEARPSEIKYVIKKGYICYCDSADPRMIKELKLQGVPATGATKGGDSVEFGIMVMQGNEYLVTKTSVNLISELNTYMWGKDRRGQLTGKPKKERDHAIDATRYHESEVSQFSGIKW